MNDERMKPWEAVLVAMTLGGAAVACAAILTGFVIAADGKPMPDWVLATFYVAIAVMSFAVVVGGLTHRKTRA